MSSPLLTRIRLASCQKALATAWRSAALRQCSSQSWAGQAHDQVEMRGLVFHGYHGVLPEERTLGQKFRVDVDLGVSLQRAGQSDDLRDTVDYAALHGLVRGVVEGPPRQLVEAVAEDIAAQLLGATPEAHSVRVAVHKPHVAVPGQLTSLGVSVVRRRGAE